MGLPWKLQVCQTMPVCTLLILMYTTDFKSHRKSNIYILHLNYVQLYETLHLEMAAHFQKVTETGQSLKQVILRRFKRQCIIRRIPCEEKLDIEMGN